MSKRISPSRDMKNSFRIPRDRASPMIQRQNMSKVGAITDVATLISSSPKPSKSSNLVRLMVLDNISLKLVIFLSNKAD